MFLYLVKEPVADHAIHNLILLLWFSDQDYYDDGQFYALARDIVLAHTLDGYSHILDKI
jgi:hypothetical protein